MKFVAEFEVESPKKIGQLTDYLSQVSDHMALVKFLGLKEKHDAKPKVLSEVRQESVGEANREPGEPGTNGEVTKLAGSPGSKPKQEQKRRNGQNGLQRKQVRS